MEELNAIEFYNIDIKYHTDIMHMEKIGKGDWIDLRCAEDVEIKKGEFKLIPLGVSMKLPEGFEAHVVPRSSTFKNYGIIQTNSLGIIDSSYCGTDDQWFMPVFAMRDTFIEKNDRICQFRIVKNMPNIGFYVKDTLCEKNRGGHGSTGKNS